LGTKEPKGERKMMEAFITLDDPSQLNATMEITMKIEYWKYLKRQLNSNKSFYAEPMYSFSKMVERLINDVEGRFTFKGDDDD
jgi:hypothetical protein